ncbi:monomeric [bacterium]|nr:monomeric [FeFe] hydrogenase [bacterium]
MNNAGHNIQLKKEILIRLIKAYLSDDFEENTRLIPFDMRPKGMEVPYRCCIYKERAILKDRTIAGLGFNIEEDDETVSLKTYAKRASERTKIDETPLTVLQAACKGCATNRIYVTDLCQGCVARPCTTSCKFGAIKIKNSKAKINDEKCKKCQMCVKACPYNAIVKISVPCEDACPVGAIKKDETGFANIDFSKCISCGKCLSACPFGAVHEKSQIIDILKAMKNKKKVIALIAPAVAGQFPCDIYQLKGAILKAGFSDVVEVAKGADITAKNEAKEFLERMENKENFMTTSCCAGYNQFIKKHLPEIKPFVSNTKTPLFYTAQIVKQQDKDAVTVFVSPCVAKRAEGFEDENVDYVMNVEELGALFVAKQIEIQSCDKVPYDTESSKQGRNFATATGVSKAVKAALKDEEMVKPCYINGLNKDAIRQLKNWAKAAKLDNDCNLVEVMCCEGGCIGGNAVINSQKISKKMIDELISQSKDIEKI